MSSSSNPKVQLEEMFGIPVQNTFKEVINKQQRQGGRKKMCGLCLFFTPSSQWFLNEEDMYMLGLWFG